MEPIPYTNDLYRFVLLLAILVWAVPEMIGSTRQWAGAGTKERDHRSGLLVRIAIFFSFGPAFALAAILSGAAIPWAREPLFWIGAALPVIGTAFRWYSIRVLGRFFTRNVAIHTDHTVVQDGPYRLIRHPSYAGELLVFAGVGLMLGNWVALLIMVGLPLIALSYRMHVEEQALIEGIGDPYREYMRHTRRLIPFVF